MYQLQPRRKAFLAKWLMVALTVTLVVPPSHIFAEGIIKSAGIVTKISAESERLEITVNSSRILTLGTRIPRIQINNPDLIAVKALSATEIQVSALKAGVTQINLWDENGNTFSVDVLIYGDARELSHALKVQFPNTNIKVFRYSNSLVLKGTVDRADHVTSIMELARDYAPKVIDNMTVTGVHQIMLKVKVMEVSRTKLRRLGFDFAQVSGTGGYAASAVSGLLASVSPGGNGGLAVASSGGETFSFGLVSGNNAFYGFLDALQQNNLMKILAEPTLTTISGRPASFNVGGEFPVLVPQSLGTVSIEYKKFGTQVDFLPIVMGNGNIRLEVRPRVSEIDNTRSVVINGITVPGLRVREIDTAVELKAGQTLALAGLIQERIEAQNRGLPIVSDIPLLGVPFRKVDHAVNEIELLILVTPEYVDAMDPHEVPPCGPGLGTQQPSNTELYFGGHLEVTGHRAPCGPAGCGLPNGAAFGPVDVQQFPPQGVYGPVGSGELPVVNVSDGVRGPQMLPANLPGNSAIRPTVPRNAPFNPQMLPGTAAPQQGGIGSVPQARILRPSQQVLRSGAGPRPVNRPSNYIRDNVNRNAKVNNVAPASSEGPGLIGPVGYDVSP